MGKSPVTNLLVVGYQDGILIFFDHPQSDLGHCWIWLWKWLK
jgi:hypothetical protein